jgi:hypothetical protein
MMGLRFRELLARDVPIIFAHVFKGNGRLPGLCKVVGDDLLAIGFGFQVIVILRARVENALSQIMKGNKVY